MTIDPATLKPNAILEADGASCATLTPMIKASIRDLQTGDVLVVHTDDPSARDSIPAWSRLTGNTLLAVELEDSNRAHFYLRKK